MRQDRAPVKDRSGSAGRPFCASTTRWLGNAPPRASITSAIRYLLRLAELEMINREQRLVERRIRLVLELARCEYLARPART
jgi:hypothetical protein